MVYDEDRFLQLSGIQHYLFCRRQWALIHIEEQWKDNLRTTEGNIMHEKAHNADLAEMRGDTLIFRGLRVNSNTMGISGQCDVVEFHRNRNGISLQGRDGLWMPYPVEYKRGRPKTGQHDEVQLCAEAMCLEEMLCTSIPKGAFYYGEIRRREEIIFTVELRNLVTRSFEEMHKLYEQRYTPKSKTGKWCNACSLKEICIPAIMNHQSVKEYVKNKICENS